jgi:beta-N-acetylhexosaminidase
MERGAGQQVEGLPHLPDLGVYGLAATPEDVERLGEETARAARSVGVDVLFAPVLDVRSEPDNPIVGNRSFGWDPERVGALGAAYCRGALAGGAAPVGKHVPGHGATTDDSHDAVPVVREDSARLLARDLAPFETTLREGGCPALMTAHVAYPALDPEGAIASFSRPILDRVRALAPEPERLTLFCDALLMAGALGAGSEARAAELALAAGCDALLYPEQPERVAAEMSSGAAAERARSRIEALLATIAAASGRAARPARGADALAVARRALELAGAGRIRPERRALLVLDDDGVALRGTVLARSAAARGVRVEVLRVPEAGAATGLLAERGSLTVVVLASVRAWKGASGVSPALARLVAAASPDPGAERQWIWLAPRAARGAVHLPGTGPDVERALAEALFGAPAQAS